jgi:integration host factor subunit alpha
MTRAEISKAVNRNTDLSPNDADIMVTAVFDLIKVSLEQGENIKLPGFGSFTVRDKRQRDGRNPKTGEAMPITARKVVTFKASHLLRDRVSGG